MHVREMQLRLLQQHSCTDASNFAIRMDMRMTLSGLQREDWIFTSALAFAVMQVTTNPQHAYHVCIC